MGRTLERQPEIPPTPTGPKARRRWPIVTAVAAAVVALLAASALVIAAQDDDTDEIPATPTTTAVAPDTAAAAEQTARGFLEAGNAYDADRALTYLSEDYIAAELGTPEEYRLSIAHLEAQGYKQIVNDCEQQGDSPSGVIVRCAYDFHAIRSDEIGLGPYTDNYWDLTIRNGKIVSAVNRAAFMTNGFSSQMWEPFARWVSTAYPDDAAVMYTDGTHTIQQTTEESNRLWEQRSREYVAADTRVGFIGLPPEAAAPSTPETAELVKDFAWCAVPTVRRIGGVGICQSVISVYEDGRVIWYLHENLPEGANPFSTGLLEQRLTPEGVELFRSGVEKTTDPEELVARLRDPASWPAGTWADPEIRAYVPSSYDVCFLQSDTAGPIGSESLALLPAPAQDMAHAWDWRENHYGGGPFDYCPRSRSTEEARSFAEALDDAQVEQGWREKPFALAYHFGPVSAETVYLVITPALPHGVESWESRR